MITQVMTSRGKYQPCHRSRDCYNGQAWTLISTPASGLFVEEEAAAMQLIPRLLQQAGVDANFHACPGLVLGRGQVVLWSHDCNEKPITISLPVPPLGNTYVP
jgi:hypothetical protein